MQGHVPSQRLMVEVAEQGGSIFYRFLNIYNRSMESSNRLVVSEEDASLVEAAKSIGKTSGLMSTMHMVPETDVNDLKATASTLYNNNLQCLSTILNLRRENYNSNSDHLKKMTEIQMVFEDERNALRAQIDDMSVKLAEKEERMKALQSQVALQGAWESILSPSTFPIPDLSSTNSSTNDVNEMASPSEAFEGEGDMTEGVQVDTSLAICSAMRALSIEVAKSVIKTSARDPSNHNGLMSGETFVSKLLEAVWFLTGKVDGTLKVQQEKIADLENINKELLDKLDRQTMMYEDSLSRLNKTDSCAGVLNRGNVTPARDFDTIESSPAISIIAASSASKVAENVDNNGGDAPVHDQTVLSETDFISPERVPTAREQSQFREPSYHMPFQPHSYTKGHKPVKVTTPGGRAVSFNMNEVSPSHPYHHSINQKKDTGATNVYTDISMRKKCSFVSQHHHRNPVGAAKNVTSAYVGVTPTALAPKHHHSRSHKKNSTLSNHTKGSNDHAMNREKREFIITSKSPIDVNHNLSRISADTEGSPCTSSRAEKITIMNNGPTMQRLEVYRTNVYSQQRRKSALDTNLDDKENKAPSMNTPSYKSEVERVVNKYSMHSPESMALWKKIETEDSNPFVTVQKVQLLKEMKHALTEIESGIA